MAENEEDLSVDARVDRSARRIVANLGILLVLLAVVGGWAYFGFYQLEPGQAAIIFRLGGYQRTEEQPGLRWHWPPPYEAAEIVNVSELSREDFGSHGEGDEEAKRIAALESVMQTRDNSIVNLGFVVQYRVSDAYRSRYAVAQARPTLRDAAQAAVREVVGRMSIDGVLTERRGEVESEGERILQDILESYGMGIEIMEVELQEVQPPAQVREAFDDVIAAAQDANLAVNRAEGYKNEIVPHARAEATELVESAIGYRDAKIVESTGEATRFSALVAEYHKAPEVTTQRLYLETMEQVLPKVEKIIVEPDATSGVLPYLPLQPTRPVPARPEAAQTPPAPEDGR